MSGVLKRRDALTSFTSRGPMVGDHVTAMLQTDSLFQPTINQLSIFKNNG